MHLVFLTYALFASVFTVGKLALVTAPPFFLTALRYLIAGVILCVYEYFTGRLKKHPPWPYLPLLVCIGTFSVFLTNGLEFWGLQFLPTGKTCLFYSMSPFFSIIFAYLVLGETMTTRKWLGLLIGLVGFLILIFADNLSHGTPQFEGTMNSWAEFAVSISAFVAVIGWTYFKKLVNWKHYPINLANGYSFLIGGILGFIVSFMTETLPQVGSSQELTSLTWQIAYITIVHSIICYTLYGIVLQRFSVTFMLFAGITNPIFTALYGWIFLKEQITLDFVLCILLVGFGLYLFYLDERLEKQVTANSV